MPCRCPACQRVCKQICHFTNHVKPRPRHCRGWEKLSDEQRNPAVNHISTEELEVVLAAVTAGKVLPCAVEGSHKSICLLHRQVQNSCYSSIPAEEANGGGQRLLQTCHSSLLAPLKRVLFGIGDIEVCRGHPKLMLQSKFRLQLPPLHHTQGSHVLRVRCLYCRSAVSICNGHHDN